MTIKILPKEITRVAATIGINTIIEDGIAKIRYSFNDEKGDSIQSFYKELPVEEVSFLAKKDIDLSQFEVIFAEHNIVVAKTTENEIQP